MVDSESNVAAQSQSIDNAASGGSSLSGGERKLTMDWEGFFHNYRKPGFIPGYEIVNKLGSGVFGEVYKARKESIGKFYAVKFLKVTDEKVSEAIFKELDGLRYFAQIDHPNLVSIEDKGEVMGIPYIVMGYGGDETLKRRLSQGAIPVAEAVAIFKQVCAGVAALHEKSIIHFDLKPANVFMKGDHARVGDYGLSKLVSESHNTMSIGRGTPYYMAPEMLRRRGDHRSDIYSLGVILFEMLTGQVPFTGDSEWEVLKKHETEPVVCPPSMPQAFRSVIERAMQKDPSKRFASAGEILLALDGHWNPNQRATVPPPPPPIGFNVNDRRRITPGATATTAEVRDQIDRVLQRIKAVGGPTAERAREALLRAKEHMGPAARVKSASHDESHFVDFDRVEAPSPKVTPPPIPTGASRSEGSPVTAAPGEKAPVDASVRAAASVITLPFRIVWMLFWPIRMVFRVIGQIFVWTGKGIALFFSNFFRYAIILALTVGLGILIHGAIVGF